MLEQLTELARDWEIEIYRYPASDGQWSVTITLPETRTRESSSHNYIGPDLARLVALAHVGAPGGRYT